MMRDDLFDEAARILAGPVPRRRALKLLGGALVAAIVGTVGSTRAGAQNCRPACRAGFRCCLGPGQQPNFCIPEAQFCCGNRGCLQGRTCCGTPVIGFDCCGPNQRCFQQRCVASQG
jgi:hypothetical protein